jgi:hypothetical protein
LLSIEYVSRTLFLESYQRENNQAISSDTSSRKRNQVRHHTIVRESIARESSALPTSLVPTVPLKLALLIKSSSKLQSGICAVTLKWLLQFAQPETFHLLNTGSQPTNTSSDLPGFLAQAETTKEPAMEERSIPEMRTKDAGLVPREGGVCRRRWEGTWGKKCQGCRICKKDCCVWR